MKESAQQPLKTQMTACEDSARGHAEPGAEEGTLVLDMGNGSHYFSEQTPWGLRSPCGPRGTLHPEGDI